MFRVPKYVHVLEDIPAVPTGRPFRMVLEAVQNGLEEVGESPSRSEYDFKSPDEVDSSVGSQPHYVEKLEIGADICGHGDFEDRLADRLGIVLGADAPKDSTTDSETS